MAARTNTGVSLLRLNILRAYYALMGFGTAAVFWPALLDHSHEWGIASGAQYSLLAALSPLALLGLRYPLKMMPVIFYEFIWKALWFVFTALPLYAADRMTDAVWANVYACSIAIVLTPLVLPWRHVWHIYFAAAAEPWRRTSAA
ncbi:hypothetical protein [Sandarakinorhabdus sp.]|uniref:hypothetical protein n=1 Tax=Sandarakinorhabdus sp. TaxID=1916663 RepID=UPI00286E1110|nr:hypothetical protein [Sandarakinorhabdus sp.]